MRASSIFLASVFILAVALAGCTSQQQPGGFCGDGLCSIEERNSCNIDCRPIVAGGEQPQQGGQQGTSTQDWLEQVREERQNNPPESVPDYQPVEPDPSTPGTAVAQNIQSVLPEIGFRVANRFNLLAIGENVSGVMGTLTSAQLRYILRGGRLTSNSQAFGPRASYYDQFLTLRSGRVVFGYDDDTDRASTYLEYEEGDPIVEYYIRMNGGIFKFFEGQAINFLGQRYELTAVDPTSILLTGIDAPDTIILRNGHGAIVNGEDFGSGSMGVEYNESFMKITVLARDDIKLLPGMVLTDKVKRAQMLTNRIDLTYDGLTASPAINLQVKKGGNDYKLIVPNNLGQNYSIPVAQLNPIRPGNNDGNFFYKEVSSKDNYSITKKDYFIISNNRVDGGITTLLRLNEVNYDDEILSFTDPALEKFYVTFSGTPGDGASGDLLVYGVHHKVYVGKGGMISVDQDGNGAINGASIPIVAGGNSIIKVSEENRSVALRLIIPAKYKENSNKDLETLIYIRNDGVSIPEESLSLEYDQVKKTLVGISDFGTIFVIKREVDSHDQSGLDLLINQPLVQRFAEVILKAYE